MYVSRRRRGLGAAGTDCNWLDDFGNCIQPGPGDTVVTPGGLRLTIGAGGKAAAPAPADSTVDFLNRNSGKLLAAGGALVAVMLLSKVAGR